MYEEGYIKSKIILIIKSLPHFPEDTEVLWKKVRKEEKKVMQELGIFKYKSLGFREFKRLYSKYNKKEEINENFTRRD